MIRKFVCMLMIFAAFNVYAIDFQNLLIESRIVENDSNAHHHLSRLKDLDEDEKETSKSLAKFSAQQSKEGQLREVSSYLSNLDRYSTQLSLVGEEMAAVEVMWKRAELRAKYFPPQNKLDLSELDELAIDHSVEEDAISVILNEAKNKQIVILNEAHHAPVDRSFAMQLAKGLHDKLGFEYLACETFAVGDDKILSKGYVTEATGAYSNESTFANFLSKAIVDRWKFVSYETAPELDGTPEYGSREYGMAKNILDRVLSSKPKAKIFIYVGYGHASKFPKSMNNNDDSKFAAQLSRLTGIEPLTIDQTFLSANVPGGDTKRALYKSALRKGKAGFPFVLLNKKSVPLKFSHMRAPQLRQGYDILVAHPTYDLNLQTGRPNWMGDSRFGNLTPHDIPEKFLPKSGRRVIYAFRRNAPEDAVPVDVVLVRASKAAPKLMLPPGEFTLEYED